MHYGEVIVLENTEIKVNPQVDVETQIEPLSEVDQLPILIAMLLSKPTAENKHNLSEHLKTCTSNNVNRKFWEFAWVALCVTEKLFEAKLKFDNVVNQFDILTGRIK